MKHLALISLLFTFAILTITAQTVPQSFNYQGVARENGNLVVGGIGVQISIRSESPLGQVIYQEQQFPSTNDYGVFSIEVGGTNAIVTHGNLSTTDWSGGKFFMQVELDLDGGTSFTDMGTTQLLSVPYALFAETARQTLNEDSSPPILADADNDTKIQVEESADEDVIRFDIAGAEFGFMDGKTFHLAAPGASLFIGTSAGANDDGENRQNTFIGRGAGFSNNSGLFNTFIGTDAGTFNTGSFNTFIGRAAGFSNSVGSKNTFVGEDAGRQNTNGYSNTFIGTDAGFHNTAGTNNTFIGATAGFSDTTGSFNTLIGTNAGYFNQGDYNIFIGDEAGFLNTTGDANIFIGGGRQNTTGNSNTFIGGGDSNTTGSSNTFIGEVAGNDNTTGESNTFIGNYAGGQTKTGSGNTFIGNGAGDINTTGRNNLCVGSSANVSDFTLNSATAIGESAIVNASNKFRMGNSSITVIEGQVPWSTPSDGRFKNNMKENVKGLDFLLNFRPVTYQLDVAKYNRHVQSEKGMARGEQAVDPEKAAHDLAAMEQAASITYSGFVAQEVEQAARDCGYDHFSGITKPSNPNDTYGLRYSTFVVPLVKAIQEQHAIIEGLIKRVEVLEQLAATESTK